MSGFQRGYGKFLGVFLGFSRLFFQRMLFVPLHDSLAVRSTSLLLRDSPLPSKMDLGHCLHKDFRVDSYIVSAPTTTGGVNGPGNHCIAFRSGSPLRSSRGVCESYLTLSRRVGSLLNDHREVLIMKLKGSSIAPSDLNPTITSEILTAERLGNRLTGLFSYEISILAPNIVNGANLRSRRMVGSTIEIANTRTIVIVSTLTYKKISGVNRTVRLSGANVYPNSKIVGDHERVSQGAINTRYVTVKTPAVTSSGSLKLVIAPGDVSHVVGRASQLVTKKVGLDLRPGLSLDRLRLLYRWGFYRGS